MKRLLSLLVLLALAVTAAAAPLRVFIRAGKKTHGPNAHEHERFLADWKTLLAARGATVDGALDWPTAAQFAQTDVIIVHAQSGGDATEEQKQNLAEFTQRGGGLVVLHAGVVASDPAWWKSLIGGAWLPGKTKFKEGPMDLYYTENQRLDGGHPITRGASNFHLDDEIYYDLDLAPEVRVLATSYTPNVPAGKKAPEGGEVTIYDIQPQMWAYEKDGARAFVSIPGHLYATFAKPHYRALLLRGLAWAGRRAQLDEFTRPEEIAALTYPEGGPQRPADTLKSLEIHPDFTLKLVAAEPLISKPMNFDWAPDGALWVAETPEYPNGRRGMRPDYRGREWKDRGGLDPTPGEQPRKGQDKISRLTDTDGDGVMDKKQVFYDGLELVTGLVFYRDGVIVTQAPDILWLRDTDGDGQADQVEKLYTGLGTFDTHAVINNPRWGWDGWIYATHGYSSSDKVRNVRGEKMPVIGSGVVRFRPDGSAIEQYSSKGGNTWGLTITGDNRVLWTQPTSGELLMQTVLPEYALARGKVGKTASYHVIEPSKKTFPAMTWEQQAYRQIDWVGSFTSAAGCVIYDGGSWPAEYHGDYFTTEPTINIVHHARLTPQGSSSTFHKLPGREETEFIRSRDMWWRPIEVRVGPDGAVYIGDFYNQAVIHNDTRGPDHNKVNAAVRPDRDHYFGRIWRLDHKDAKKLVVPDLSKADVATLAKALKHPNRAVRMTASRLLVEKYQATLGKEPSHVAVENAFKMLAPALAGNAETKIAAFWTLQNACGLGAATIESATADLDAGVRRNAALLAEVAGYGVVSTLLQDRDAAVRLAALRAMSARNVGDDNAKVLVSAWPKFDDDFQRSAAVGALAQNPAAAIAIALDFVSGRVGVPPAGSGILPERSSAAERASPAKPSPAAERPPGETPDSAGGTPTLPETNSLAPLIAALTPYLTAPADAAKMVISLAGHSAAPDLLKRTILDSLAQTVKDAPPMTPELSAALGKLLASGASGSVLPLAAKWDKTGSLKPAIDQLTRDLFTRLGTGADADRLNAALALIGLRSTNAEVLPAVAKLLADAKFSADAKRQLVTILGETGDPAAGAAIAAAFPQLDATAQTAAFDALLKRSDWAAALLDGVRAKTISLANLGPAHLARLRTHPDPAISQRATGMLDELNPSAKAKNEIIAKLSAVVEAPGGDPVKGKATFAMACAICHAFDGAGANVGPGLTGMGSHAPGELLTAIVDPNREVDPSFVTWNFETKNGQFLAGIIARENPAAIVVRSLAGEQEVKTADIKTRTNTGRSLMPEGFEGLGAEQLRDIIAYMASVDGGGFRTLDLSTAFTASSARGFYGTESGKSIDLVKTGTLKIGGIPFNVVAPEKSPGGKNVVNLKGGPAGAYSRQQMPQRVEVKVGGFTANRLHFLGGIGGWAYPFHQEKFPVMTCIVNYADGSSERLVFHNGIEFADHIARHDVPGSAFAEGVTRGFQMRAFSKQLKKTAPLASLVLESADNEVAPTTLAITAELLNQNAAPVRDITQSTIPEPIWAPRDPGVEVIVPSIIDNPIFSVRKASGSVEDEPGFKPQFTDPVPQPPATRPASGPRVLLVGGGSSHDFVKFFGGTDKATLTPVAGWIEFTQNLNGIAPILKDIDVLVLSANQPISAATRQALIDFANAGKGLVALHPGTWYAWNNFPQWNKEIIGGGTRGHDALGPFPVTVTNSAHPITKGVPATFELTDELYNYAADPAATPIEVLATATSPKSGKAFPQVFIVKHPQAKIVGLTLGHDARAHDHPAFQTLLKNAVQWAGAQ